MRVLAVEPGPQFSVADVHRGWVKGLREIGCEVVSLNFSDRLGFYEMAGWPDETGEFRKALEPEAAVRVAAKGIEVACYEFWPDVVLITSGFYVPPDCMDLMRARGHKVVMLHTEEP